MNTSALCFLLVCSVLVASVSCRPDAMLAPPQRPAEFRTPEQLRKYLKALNDYYAIVGRPRFGRSANKQPLDQMYSEQAAGSDFGDLWYNDLTSDSYDDLSDSDTSYY